MKKQHPADRAARMKPAPRPLRLKAVSMSTTLPPSAAEIVDGLVGTLLGNRRSAVLRFIVKSWIVDHARDLARLGR